MDRSYDQLRQHIKKQRHYFANKGPYIQSYGFSSSHVWMWELDCEESWALKNWCFWTVVLEKSLESPLDCKEIQTVNLKGNQSWIFIERTDAEAEAPILWPLDVKNWLIGKDLDAGKDWRQENGTTEDEMAGWHHWLDGHESEWTPGVGDGQGGLTCCNSWGHKESDTTERLNWTELNTYITSFLTLPLLLLSHLSRLSHSTMLGSLYYIATSQLVQFRCSVGSNSLRPHRLQHARPPCPSPPPEVCPSSCPLYRWCLQKSHSMMPSSSSLIISY